MATIAATPQQRELTVDGRPLSLSDVCETTIRAASTSFRADPSIADRMAASVAMVREALRENRTVYGLTTGFGGMVGAAITPQLAAASQNNLLAFLAAGAGPPLDGRHVRGAMLLRANVLAQGCSGIRFEAVARLLRFLNFGATPVVREYGSIGASGDLIPLSTIARAITGHSDRVRIDMGGANLSGTEALQALGLAPLELQPKEALALVNGTSFSAAIAAHATWESQHLLSLTLGGHAMMLQALLVHHEPFHEFVHRCKPHPGQVWAADVIRRLLASRTVHADRQPVQDRYSLRCLPQYVGPAVDGIARVAAVVHTEMNAVSDNPVIDVAGGRFHQSGNFLGQYVGVAMDELRRHLGLLAKHLDVQIAALVTPEFSNGLPASLQGNADVPYNMGLKGLQITGNSIMPLLTHLGQPLVEHFPTHAEQYNQNINGLSWGSAIQTWKAVELYQHYLAVALICAVQAVDLRARQQFGHADGRALLSEPIVALYEAVCASIDVAPDASRPLLFDDRDLWLEDALSRLQDAIHQHADVVQSVGEVTQSFRNTFPES